MKELEDYAWFPTVFRNFQTEYIGYLVVQFKVYEIFIEYLQSLKITEQKMTDLCSGTGAPAIAVFKKSPFFSLLTLTDKIPVALALSDGAITYPNRSTDVLEMEFNSETCYTMFNAFHHFSAAEQKVLIQKMQHSGCRAFIVEILEPTILCLLKVFFATTIGYLLISPFIAPFSLKRLVFTYVIPINLFTITYDGIISVFKSRSAEEYQTLFKASKNPLNIFRIKGGLSPLVVLQIEPNT